MAQFDTSNAIDTVKSFLGAYFVERDAQKATSFLDKDVCWIDGPHMDRAYSLKELRRIVAKHVSSEGKKCELELRGVRVCECSEGLCTLCADAEVLYGSDVADVAVTFNVCMKSGKIKLVHMSFNPKDRYHSAPGESSTPVSEATAARYDALLRNASWGFMVATQDPDGSMKVAFVNDGMCNMLGVTQKEFFEACSEDLFCGVHPSEREYIRGRFNAALQSGGILRESFRLSGGAKRNLWVEMTACIFAEQDGTLCAYIGCTDINELKQKEQRLLENQSKLQAAIDHAELYFWEYDIPSSSVSVGYRFTRDFGVPEKLSGYPETFIRSGVIHPGSIDDFLWLHDEMKKGTIRAEKKIQLNDAYGGVWLLVRFTNYFGSDGKPSRAFATAENLDEYMELEERFETACFNEGILTWVFDFNTRRMLLSESTAQRAGLDGIIENAPESLYELGRVYAEDIPRFRRMHARLLAGQRTVSENIRVLSLRSGAYDWYRFTYTSVCDKSGTLIKAVGSASNITAQVEAENRFVAFQTYRRFAFNNTLVTFRLNLTKDWCGDAQGDLQELMNLAQAGTVQGLLDNVLGCITDEQDKRRYSSTLNRTALSAMYARGVVSPSAEFRAVIGGKPMWVRAMLDMMENPKTHDVEALAYALNIDREKRTQAVIDRLVERDYDFVATIDLQADEVELFAQKSHAYLPAAERDSYSGTLEYYMNKLIAPEQALRAISRMSLDSIKRVLERNDQYECTFPTLDEKGATRYKNWRFFYLDAERRLMLFTRSDVTESYGEEQRQKKRLTEALRSANAANEAKSDFLARMSHDMRTPMNGIIGLLRLTLAQDLPEDVRENLHKMDYSSRFLLSLINDTLDMNKIESHKITLNPELTDSAEWLEGIIASVRSTATEKGVELVVDMGGLENEHFHIDPVRTQQIFINALSNAVKFTMPGGRVDFIAKCERRKGRFAYCRFVVRDTGIGISEEFLPKVFEPFEQEYNAVNMKYAGTGLGMPIVKNLVELMGGRIELKSQLGVGTEITIWLALETVDSELANKPAKSTARTNLKGRCILLCEDNALNTEIAVRLLESQGCTVECEDNGRDGVARFGKSAEGHFDAILMDIRMPLMDGLTAAKLIRELKREDAQRVPIIAMTANAFDADVRKSREAGMNNHLAKPVEPAVLFDTLAYCIAEREEEETRQAES